MTVRKLLLIFGGAGILLFANSILYGKPRPTPQGIKVPKGKLRIVFAGDTSFGENYQKKIERRGGENILKTKGYAYSLHHFASFLSQANLVVANLETPITDLPSSPLSGKKTYLHWGDLSKTPKTLKVHNIGVVSLANNHTLDYGITGLQQSMDALREYNIQWFGAGSDEASASQPLHFQYQLKDRPFQLIIAAGFEYRDHYAEDYNFYAKGNKGGTNAWNVSRASAQIKTIRQANPGAFIVAYPHFGRNYAWKTSKQTRLAHALIDSGADLVIGHGAHVLQEIEQYQGRWIVYNLGNFVFNSPGRYQKQKAAPFSLVALLEVVRKNERLALSLRLYPIFSDNRITRFRPHFVTESQFHKVRELLLVHTPTKSHLLNKMGMGHDEYGQYLMLDVAPDTGIRPQQDCSISFLAQLFCK